MVKELVLALVKEFLFLAFNIGTKCGFFAFDNKSFVLLLQKFGVVTFFTQPLSELLETSEKFFLAKKPQNM